MELIASFFAAIGMFWSIVILAVAVLLVGACTENDNYFWAAILTVVAGVTLFGSTIMPTSLKVHWGWTIALYVATGIVWGVLKWASYCRKEFKIFKQIQTQANKKNEKLADAVLGSGYEWRADTDYMPDPTKKKADIAAWMAYWPASFIWTIASDWIVKFWDNLVEWNTEMLRGITKAIYGEIPK